MYIFYLSLVIVFSTIISANLEFNMIFCDGYSFLTENKEAATSSAASSSHYNQDHAITTITTWGGLIAYTTVQVVKLKASVPHKVGVFGGITLFSTGSIAVMHYLTAPRQPVPVSLHALLRQKKHINENSSSTGMNFEINSPWENEGISFTDWICSFIPKSILNDFTSRLPSSQCIDSDTFNVLYLQYNLIIYVMAISFSLFLVQLVVVYTFSFLIKYREDITKKHIVLNKLIPSITVLQLITVINKIGVVINLTTIGIGLYFLYMNPISADMGFYDTV